MTIAERYKVHSMSTCAWPLCLRPALPALMTATFSLLAGKSCSNSTNFFSVHGLITELTVHVVQTSNFTSLLTIAKKCCVHVKEESPTFVKKYAI
jgi:hypothetical protein